MWSITKYLILPLVLAGAFFVWSIPRITSDYNFNSDELIYLSRSVYWDAFVHGDFKNPIWSEWGAYDQPQLTNYIYAAVPGDRSLLSPQNSPCNDSGTSFYNTWSCLDGKPLSSWDSSPLKTMVIRARALALGISSLVIATTYLIGLALAGPVAGVLAALMLGWYSFFKNLSTMTMMDQILLLFTNLMLLAALRLWRGRGNLATFALLTLSAGLALATKLSAAPVVFLIFALSFLQNRHTLGKLFASGVLALTIFVVLNPYLWPNPVTRLESMMSWRLSQSQQEIAANPSAALPTLTSRLVYSYHELAGSWNQQTVLAPWFAGLIVMGLLLLLLDKKRSLWAIFTIGNLAITLSYLSVGWNRYLLPALIPLIATAACALPMALRAIVATMRRNNLRPLLLALTGLVCGIALIGITLWLGIVPGTILAITIFLALQGYLVTRAMLYGFSSRKTKAIPPREPQKTFSLIVPARNEESVIGNTIASLSHLDYPHNLYEVLVMIRADDHTTHEVAAQAIKRSGAGNIRIVAIDGDANNKAYSLNLGAHFAKNEVIGIFDAEDEPSPAILRAVNSQLLANPQAKVIQAPVHLVNLNGSWFSGLNAVEYYFWFRSVLPYLSQKGAVPLGGNTVFIKKTTIQELGGYDENCLTEDADLGIRLAAAKIPVAVIDDPALATKEETPESEVGVIRQRARWDQGYLQVVEKGNWETLDGNGKLYALYTLTQPIFRHLSFLNMVLCPLLASLGYIPLWVALISFLPSYFLLMQFGLYLLGLSDLAKLHHLHLSIWRYLALIIGFIPYQALLALGTTRAVGKSVLGDRNWDKTEHVNAHRPLAILEA